MDYKQKKELIDKVEDEYGIYELFTTLDLIDVTKKGKAVYCVCPFHTGADNPEAFCYTNGFGYCFTHCNRKFDLYEIVMKAKNCDFMESLNYLASLVNYDIEYSYNPEIKKFTADSHINRNFLKSIKRVKTVKETVEWKPIDTVILSSFEPVMHTKLRQEGFDNDVRDYFNLGYSTNGYLQGRITIPVDYIDGSIVTVAGRSTLDDGEIKRLKLKKYLVWYETEKGVTLYNISRALPSIKQTNEVIVVEGYKSVWRLYQWGIQNAVAVMGSTLTEQQRKILLRLSCDIIVCGDRDEAGQLLNKQVLDECGKFSNVKALNLHNLNVPDKSSIDNITFDQFKYLMSTI